MRLTLGSALVAALLFAGPSLASASTITINFDSLSAADPATIPISNVQPLTNQYSGLGVTFSNAIALFAGTSLNELDFPARSKNNVASDDGGPILISFAAPLFNVQGFFTYLSGLTFEAFASTNGTGSVLASATSTFSNNLAGGPGSGADPGSLPNEGLLVSSALGIRSVRITGDLLGGSFTLDDLTLTDDFPGRGAPVPEPSTFVLMLGGAAAAFIGKRRKDARRNNR